MKLNKLSLHNFKGVRDFLFMPDGDNATITGKNGTGKTTIADAMAWLLTGKDSKADTSFPVKTLIDGEPEHNLEHIVEGEFSVTGDIITLKKVFKEKWTKKRGESKKTFTGHTTDHYIDGVPVGKREFQNRISELMQSEETLRLLTDPLYFSEKLKWEKRRELLLEICGNITDQQVFLSDKELEQLMPILDGKSPDDYRKIATQTRRKINEDLKTIPARIDEVKTNMPELEVSNSEVLVKKLADLREKLSGKQKELAGFSVSGERNKVLSEIKSIEAEKNLVISAFNAKETERTAKLEADKNKFLRNAGNIRNEINNATNEIERLVDENSKLRKEFIEISNSSFEFEDICPTCGQDIPEEKQKEALESFNIQKAESLEEINKKGKANKVLIEELQESLEGEEEQAEKMLLNAREIEKQLSETVAFDTSEVDLKIEKAMEKLSGVSEQTGNEELEEEITSIEQEIAENEKLVANIEQYHQAQERIKELSDHEKELSVKFEETEHVLYLLDQFNRKKAELLSGNVSKHFGRVSFKLFEEQVNEGLKPICETTMDGKPWAALSNGERINAGLDVIKTLAKHYEFAPPIFIDNAESVTSFPDMDQQVIKLVAVEGVEKLTISE